MTNPIKRWLLLLAGVTATLIATVAFAEGVVEASVSVSGTSARTSADLGPGWKAIRCDVAVFFRTGVLPTAVTTDLPIGAGSVRQVYITNSEKRLAFITSGGTGTCRIYPLNVGPNGNPPDTLAVDGSDITPSSVTSTGNVTGHKLISSSTDGAECSITMQTQTYLCMSGNDTALLTYNGSAITSNVDFDAANLSATDITAGQKVKGAIFALTSTNDLGTVTLVSGTPSTQTATVRSGAKCFCQNVTTQANPVKCAVSGTTLTVTGPNSVTDNVNYFCPTTT